MHAQGAVNAKQNAHTSCPLQACSRELKLDCSCAVGFVFLFCVVVGSGWFTTSLAVFWFAFVFWAVFLCLFGCGV
jgi:hypothetical protein